MGVLGFAGWAAVAGAQEASISGTVVDESGAALPGATVTALSTASGKQTAAVTDGAGRYEIKGLSAGPYRLTGRLQGFSEVGHSVPLSPGEAVTRDLTLDVGSLSEEITVTAAKGERATSEIPQIVTIVGSNQIEDRRPAGVQEALERTPGMRAIETNPYRARPQLRGLDGSRVALMIDGERLNNARFDVGVTGVPPAIVEVAQLDSIEVVAGAGSSLYGSDAMVGTVNLITKPPRRPESGMSLDARGDVDYQTNGHLKKGTLAANLASRKLALRGTVSKFDLDDYHISGRQGIDREDVLRLGRFAVELGNAFEPGGAAATNVAGSYGVFELPRGSGVPNAGAAGWSSLADAWYHPTQNQNVRLKHMRTRQDDLGAPFTGPPYSPLQQRAFFSDFDKVSARYEALEITKWLSRASVGVYRQKLSRPQNDLRFDIVRGSSFVGTTPATLALTGRDSDYAPGVNNETESNITSWGLDLQINMLPIRGVLYTTGVGYLRDESVDHFSRETVGADGLVVRATGLKTTPDTTYRNVGWFNQLEVTRVPWLRLSGGFRIDNWKSEAVPSPGYPPPSELYVQQTSLPKIFANPGALNIAGLQGLEELLKGRGSLTSTSTVATGNVGALLLLSGGVHPYVRFGTSYREPEVTVRYGIRNFGPPNFSVQAIPNTPAKPERGRSLDLGLKLERRSVRACLGYYRNDLSGFSSTVVSTYEIPPSPAEGVLPTFPGVHQVQFFQRITGDAKVHFRGWEGSGEVSIALGDKGSLTPFASLSWMKSIDDDPAAKDILIVEKYYNRSDTPIRLEGSVDEIPARPHPRTLGTVALRYTSPAAKWWVEYEWRFAGRITNTDPESVLSSVTPFPTQYGALKSLEGYDKHTIRGGVKLGKDGRLRLSVGVDNLYDSLFFQPYQNAPAPGRSLILGLTLDMKNVLGSSVGASSRRR